MHELYGVVRCFLCKKEEIRIYIPPVVLGLTQTIPQQLVQLVTLIGGKRTGNAAFHFEPWECFASLDPSVTSIDPASEGF